MEKPIYKSKTLWGAFLYAVSALLVEVGVFEPSILTGLGEALGVFLGAWGIRDVLG